MLNGLCALPSVGYTVAGNGWLMVCGQRRTCFGCIDPVWASVNLGIMLCINCSGKCTGVVCVCVYVC